MSFTEEEEIVLPLITDFNRRLDNIEVNGDASRYLLLFGNFVGDSAQDTAVLYEGDLIGIAQNVTLSIADDFIFV